MVKGLLFDKVTTRNFLKVENESFQDFRSWIGVPKGTYSPVFIKSCSNQTQLSTNSFTYENHLFSYVFDVDKFGQVWTSKAGIRLRIGYEAKKYPRFQPIIKKYISKVSELLIGQNFGQFLAVIRG